MNLWYALHVRSNYERAVTDRLVDRGGFEPFYPHYLEKSRDLRRVIERKFFPGYVFVRADLDERNPAMGIPQIVGIVGAGSQPIAIPEAEIENVKILAASPLASLSAPCPFLRRGDLVRIRYGPLVGLEGYVIKDKRKTRLIVSLTMLAQSRSVEVDRAAVETIEGCQAA